MRIIRKVKCKSTNVKRNFVEIQQQWCSKKNQVLNPTATPGVNSNSRDNKSLRALARTVSFSPFLVSVIVLQSLVDLCLSDVFTATSFEVSFFRATCG
jgi:hypothetical protein